MSISHTIIDENIICNALQKNQKPDISCFNDILNKALSLEGLSFNDVAFLTLIKEPILLDKLFTTAKKVKENIYGKRLVFFAPLYISNLCVNDCAYCAFSVCNNNLKRKTLNQQEITHETKFLIDQGHKRILLVTGEFSFKDNLDYILNSIKTIYKTKTQFGEIRRINVNIAPLTVNEFKVLKTANIGTYQLFQETYHRETYKNVHLSGNKVDYDFRLSAIDRAMEAGIDDVGIGVLFGLADWRFEVLALLQHSKHLSREFGVGPHTISVPRIEPASGSILSQNPPNPLSDLDFKKAIAILRLAVPYTGIILSTRESVDIREDALSLGISQLSAGSCTSPGGYFGKTEDASQFSLGDHRDLDDVVRDVVSLGYIPSFCTACYRLGRTGEKFMHLAKPGAIKKLCYPNALITFQEYLLDYASDDTRKVGEKLVNDNLDKMDKVQRNKLEQIIKQLRSKKRDLFM